MADKARVVVRHIIMLLCFWLPATRRKKIERWLRGREEYKKLQRSDWVLMSWGKSGSTWLRVMLSRAYQLKGGLDASELLDFDNLKQSDPQLPAVFFTHNNYLRDYTGNAAIQEPLPGQAHRAAGARPARCGGVTVFPVAVSHASQQEVHQ